MSCEAAKIVPARLALPAVQSGKLPALELLLPRAALLFSRCCSNVGVEVPAPISQFSGLNCGAPW